MLTMMNFSNRVLRFRIPVMVAVLTLAAWPTVALAQDAAPMPNLTRSPNALIGFGIIAAFAVVIVTISLLPSKRGHQD